MSEKGRHILFFVCGFAYYTLQIRYKVKRGTLKRPYLKNYFRNCAIQSACNPIFSLILQ